MGQENLLLLRYDFFNVFSIEEHILDIFPNQNNRTCNCKVG